MRVLARVLAAAALAVFASAAGARAPGTTADGVYRFPSQDIQNLDQLQNAIQSSFVRVIIVAPGVYDLDEPLFVATRDDLVICGATGNPNDVVFTSGEGSAALVFEARHVVFRGLTLQTTAPFISALSLIASTGSDVENYVDDVVVDRCVLKGYVGVQAGVRVRNLTVTRSRVALTGSGSPRHAVAGVLWEDGPGLYVGRNRFTIEPGVPALAAVVVRGAQSGTSEGERARSVLLVGNTISGDFARAFDLADVVDLRAKSNVVTFPSPLTTTTFLNIVEGSGRMGFFVRRANASAFTENFEFVRNRVRKAFYAASLLFTGSGVLFSNDFRGCGSPTPDPGFGDHGGALRFDLQSSVCPVTVAGNDFRGLKSPASDPAVVVQPAGIDPADCFTSSRRNRVDKGRALYAFENQ
jgi:hypothetical protein